MAVNALPGREMTFSSIACVTLKWLVSGSGWASCSFSKLVSRPADEALRRLLAHDPALLLLVVARPGEQPRVLHLVVGGLGDDRADGVVARPARPARDLVELAGLERAGALPSYLASAVNSTVRIGTLMPTPRVSVPQMTFSSPACASVSTSRR